METNRPRGRRLGQRSNDTFGFVMQVGFKLVRVDKDIGIKSNHDPRFGSRVSSITRLTS